MRSLICCGLVASSLLVCTHARAQYSNIHNFVSGESPYGTMVASESTLYGVASTIAFMYNPANGDSALLHTFTGGPNDGWDGRNAIVVTSGAGPFLHQYLYGVTAEGGASNKGVVFVMSTDGSGYTNLHSFLGAPSDGDNPLFSSLVQGGSTLYGTTYAGGTANFGTIFKINTNGGGYAILHHFANSAGNGIRPNGALILSDSTLYGMTESDPSSLGTVFRMNTDGNGYTNIHTFTGNDGESPKGSLLLIGTTLYGMALDGGDANMGVIFKVNTDGTGFTNLHSFAGSPSDGQRPYGSLILKGSKLYGMTSEGGTTSNGVLFSISTDGSGYSTLHSFAGTTNEGAHPCGSLTPIGSTLYGMTLQGGPGDYGTVFSWRLPVVPNDFDGDRKTDIGIFRPSTVTWYVFQSTAGPMTPFQFGTLGDLPVPGDYDGDGLCDIAIFRPSTVTWYVFGTKAGPMAPFQFGTFGDMPAPADYDGDGQTDLAIYRPSTMTWYVFGSKVGPVAPFVFGAPGDIPIPADYDGDGKADLAVFRPSTVTWYRFGSTVGPMPAFQFGTLGDLPMPGDYDGDGQVDVAIFRPSTVTWYIFGTSAGPMPPFQFGTVGDRPLRPFQ